VPSVRDRRRLAARLLLVGGTLSCLWAATGWTRGALARDRARAAWEAREARAAVVAAGRIDVGHGIEAAAPTGAPVARIVIPRLGLDEVIVEGVSDDALAAGPGHLPGTPLPGAIGNAVVSAHRDRHFHPLADIAVGDTVQTETDRARTTWVVTGRRVVHREARVLRQGATAELTLTTCWPIRWFGPAPDRLIVTATPIVHVALR
jgi:sortase A